MLGGFGLETRCACRNFVTTDARGFWPRDSCPRQSHSSRHNRCSGVLASRRALCPPLVRATPSHNRCSTALASRLRGRFRLFQKQRNISALALSLAAGALANAQPETMPHVPAHPGASCLDCGHVWWSTLLWVIDLARRSEEKRMRIADWIKGKLDAHFNPDPASSFRDPESTDEVDEEEEPSEPVVAHRFRVTTVDESGKDDKVLFVYGRDQIEACERIPSPLLLNARVESAGHAENGVIHFPPEELRQAMESMCDGRKAPGA